MKIENFCVPVDFMILDIAEDSSIQIFLGRPFLATIGCKIDVKGGSLSFDYGGKYTKFSLFGTPNSPPNPRECFRINMLDEDVHCDSIVGDETPWEALEILPPPLSLVDFYVENLPFWTNEVWLSVFSRMLPEFAPNPGE